MCFTETHLLDAAYIWPPPDLFCPSQSGLDECWIREMTDFTKRILARLRQVGAKCAQIYRKRDHRISVNLGTWFVSKKHIMAGCLRAKRKPEIFRHLCSRRKTTVISAMSGLSTPAPTGYCFPFGTNTAASPCLNQGRNVSQSDTIMAEFGKRKVSNGRTILDKESGVLRGADGAFR